MRPTSDRPASFLRKVAACLVGLSGVGQVASLWLRELTGLAVLDGVLGFVYLIVAVGLLGQSRLSLLLGVVIPVTVIAAMHLGRPEPTEMYRLHEAINWAVILLCVIELWRVRDNRGG